MSGPHRHGGPFGQVLSGIGVPGPGRIIAITRVASAGEHHILFVVTVVLPPCPRGAVTQRGLTSLTAHVIQPDGPSARAVVGFAYSGQDLSATQLPAGHCGIPEVPAVITDCPPESGMPHL